MNNRNFSKEKFTQSGVVVVELAVALPVLLLLLLATGELGRVYFQHNILNKAVRDGARYVSSNAIGISNNTATVILLSPELVTKTKNLVVYNASGSSAMLPSLNASQVTVALSGSENLLVSVSYPYQPMFGQVLPMFGFGDDIDVGFTLNASMIIPAL